MGCEPSYTDRPRRQSGIGWIATDAKSIGEGRYPVFVYRDRQTRQRLPLRDYTDRLNIVVTQYEMLA